MMTKRNSMYQVSANRNSATHKVRYVESSMPEEGECRLCVGVLPKKDERLQTEPNNSNT